MYGCWNSMKIKMQWLILFFIFSFYEKDRLKFNRNEINWLNFFIWKCMLEWNGEWDVEIDFSFIHGNGCWKSNRKCDNMSEFLMCAYCNSMDNRIERLIFFFFFFFLMKMHAKSNGMWSIEWKSKTWERNLNDMHVLNK